MKKTSASSSSHNQRIGKWGEQTAIDVLVAKGYQVVERNIYTPYGEIDIVALKDGFYTFIEVKARTTNIAGKPEDAVNSKKRNHMVLAAQAYADTHDITTYQLDVIAIEGSPSQIPEITHFENI